MERLGWRKRVLPVALVTAGGLLLGACGGGQNNPEKKDKAPYVEGDTTDSDWRITNVDKVGTTEYHGDEEQENEVYFVVYSDKEGNTLLCKENRPYRFNAGPSESCNWEAYNQQIAELG